MAITSATGGTITTSGAYTVHTFTAGGTFAIVSGFGDVEYLIVGGGGGGGGYGGGGGGRVLTGTDLGVGVGSFPIVVGGGGARTAGGSSAAATAGSASSFNSHSAAGGGGGSGNVAGGNGASGGGGGYLNNAGGSASAGNAGGSGYNNGSTRYSGGGGGGAGGGGQTATSTLYGNGGLGVSSSIDGTAKYYGAGGGAGNGSGSNTNVGVGGSSVGGNGSYYISGTTWSAATSPVANSGSGGGGGGSNDATITSKRTDGAAGIVVVRYLTPNAAPAAAFSRTPTSGDYPLLVSFDASASTDSDGTIVSYNYDWGDGTSHGTSSVTTHTYTTDGTFTITLTVTDDDGATDTETHDVTVTIPNAPPVAAYARVPASGIAPLAVAFDASASADSDGTIVAYAWDLDNGDTPSGVTAWTTYDTPGTYSVDLTVTDDGGATDSVTHSIVVSAPDEPELDLKVRAALYEADNQTPIRPLSGVVGWKDPKKGIGTLSVDFKKAEWAGVRDDIEQGLVLRGVLLGDRRSFIIDTIEPTVIDGQEDPGEGVTVTAQELIVDFAESIVHAPPGAMFHPPIDDVVFMWYSPYDVEGPAWTPATIIAVQGFESPYWTGVPGDWRDGEALWMWNSDGTVSDAPEETFCDFREWVTVPAGVKALDFTGDNQVTLWLNGRLVGQTDDLRNKRQYLFDSDAGQVLVAAQAYNGTDDGPPGGNPAGFIATMTQGLEGAVIWRSGSSLKVADPADLTSFTVPRILRLLRNGNEAMDDWTFAFTDTTDSNGAAAQGVDNVSLRRRSDSVLDALDQFTETLIERRTDVTGKVLRIYNKGTVGTVSDLALVTGDSTAGQADPSAVNVTGLRWTLKRAPFDALSVRYDNGEFTRGSGKRWRGLDLGQLGLADATAVADALLDVWAVGIASCRFTYWPRSIEQYPYEAFDIFDQIAVPTASDVNTFTNMDIAAITVQADADGDPTFVIDVGSPKETRAAYIERWIARSARGGAGGLAAAAQPAAITAPRLQPIPPSRVTVASVPYPVVGRSGGSNPPGTIRVNNLRCVDVQNGDATGTTTIKIYRQGVVISTVTLLATDTEWHDEGYSESWADTDVLYVDITAAGGHTGINITAGYSQAAAT